MPNKEGELKPVESLRLVSEGIKITLTNPELLRAYILDPERKTAASLAERISGIKERVLGEFPLDGKLFQSAKFTLVIEPDPDLRGGRPTAIIRADLSLSDSKSSLSAFQAAKESDPKTTPSFFEKLTEALENPSALESGLNFIEWSQNTLRVHPSLEKETLRHSPLILLQIWDKDVGRGSISISLLSLIRYSEAWMKRNEKHKRRVNDNWEVDIDDETDRWQFNQPVGIDVFEKERFSQVISFYEKAFPEVIRVLYQVEALPLPSLNLAVEPPLVFDDQEVMTFNDIGGQSEAVNYLRALAASVKAGNQVVAPILLVGPPGYGKSSLVRALATELNIPLVKKTSSDLPRPVTEVSVKVLIEAAYLEARAAAVRSGGQAILCLENLEHILGQDIRLHDFLINQLDSFTSGQVIVMATSNSPALHLGIIDRCTTIPILPPDRRGVKEILQIHLSKMAKLLGQDFTSLNLDKISDQLRAKRISGRGIRKLLNEVYLLSRQEGREIDTELFSKTLNILIPDRSFGFKTPGN